MAIIRWQPPASPFEELNRMRQEMDRLFRDYSGGAEPFFSRAFPAVNITEDAENFYVRGELPGIRAEDLDVSVVEGGLLIRGERKLATEDKQANYHRREREAGFFRRMIALPARVGAELSFDTPLEAPCSRCQGAGRVGHFTCGFCVEDKGRRDWRKRSLCLFLQVSDMEQWQGFRSMIGRWATLSWLLPST